MSSSLMNDALLLLFSLHREISIEETKEQSARQDSQNVQQQLHNIESEYRNCNNSASSSEREMNNQKEELRRLTSNDQGRAGLFGQYVPAILQRIQATRFKGEVIGPLGMHVKMKDGMGRWCKAAEFAMGKTLNAFVVTCAEDQRVLAGILSSLSCQAQHGVICQRSSERYTVPTIEGVLTVLNVIQIDHGLAYNCLIDQRGIESTALFEEVHECKTVINGVDCYVNRNIRTVYLANGDSVIIKNGNTGVFATRLPFKNILTEDTSQYIAVVEERIAQHMAAMMESKNQASAMFHTLEDMKKTLKNYENQMKTANMACRRLTKQKADLENELLDIQEAGRIDTTALEDDEKQLKDAIIHVTKQIEERQAVEQGLQAELKTCKENANAAQRHWDTLMVEFQKLEKKLQNFLANNLRRAQNLEKAKKNLQQKQKIIDEIKKAENKLIAQREDLLVVVNEKVRLY